MSAVTALAGTRTGRAPQQISPDRLHVCAVTSSSGHSVVRVEGPLTRTGDAHLADMLDMLISAGRVMITVDLTRASLRGRSAIHTLLRAHHAQRASGGRLQVQGMDEDVRRTLAAAGLTIR